MQNIKPFFIKVITPLHAGSGSDLGVVDMPIQREAHTGFPKIEASSLKGAIRSEFTEKNSEEEAEKIFGTGDKAGVLGFSDAKILFFSIKSVKGVFAYITCPMVLERLEVDLNIGSEASASQNEVKTSFPKSVDDDKCFVFKDNKNKIDKNGQEYVILEEYSFKSETLKDEVKTSFPKDIFNEVKERLVIISDDNFAHFVKNSTEVITRIKIGKDGVVDKEAGALFTEEYLPSETIMYSLAIGDNKYIEDTKKVLQVGGNTTLGKGIVELSIGVKND